MDFHEVGDRSPFDFCDGHLAAFDRSFQREADLLAENDEGLGESSLQQADELLASGQAVAAWVWFGERVEESLVQVPDAPLDEVDSLAAFDPLGLFVGLCEVVFL